MRVATFGWASPADARERAPPGVPAGPFVVLNVGGDLLSHTLTGAVPSALEGLASGFGMGPGVPRSATTTDNTIRLAVRSATRLSYSFSFDALTQTQELSVTHRTARAATRPTPGGNFFPGWGGVVVCSGSHSGCEYREMVVGKPSAY